MLPWQGSLGISPIVSPPGTFPALVGVDGRVQGSLKRYLGNLLLTDVRQDVAPDYASAEPLVGTPSQMNSLLFGSPRYSPIEDVFPFNITKGQTAERIWGFVVVHRAFNPTHRPWQTTPPSGSDFTKWQRGGSREYYTDCDTATSTKQRYVSLLVRDTRPDDSTTYDWYWVALRVANGYTASATNSATWNKPTQAGGGATGPNYLTIAENAVLNVVQYGRFLYISSSKGSGTAITPLTVWYDNALSDTLYRQHQGWHWDQAGTFFLEQGSTASGAVKLDFGSVAGTVTSGGIALTGVQDMAFRAVDFYRGRFSPLSRVYAKKWVGDAYYLDNLELSFSGSVGAGEEWQFKQYPYFEWWMGLSDEFGLATTTQAPVTANLRLADILKTRTQIASWASTDDWAVVDVPKDAARTDASTLSTVTVINVPEDALAVSQRFDVFQDVTRAMPTNVYSVEVYANQVYLLTADKQPDSVGGSAVNEADTQNFLTLGWSATHRIAPENFPPANQYYTRLPANDRAKLAVAGNYLYVMGTGPVYRVQRVATGVDVVELPVALELHGRDAVCEVQGDLIAVCRDGVHLLEGGGTTLTRLPEFDRVVRDFVTDLQPAEVSCAYDAQLNAVFVHLRRMTMVYWVATRQLTVLDDQPFVKVVQLGFGDGEQRAVFVSPYGRFVYPRAYESESSDSLLRCVNANARRTDGFTSLGLPTVDASDRVRGWNWRVTNVSRTSSDATFANLATLTLTVDSTDTLSGSTDPLAGEDGTHREYGWSGTPVRFVTGVLRGKSYVMLSSPSAITFKILEDYNGQLSDIAVGDIVAVGGVPFAIVGAPLESEPGIQDSLLKRQVRSGYIEAHRLAGVGWEGTLTGGVASYYWPLWHIGVGDYSGFIGHLPLSRAAADWEIPYAGPAWWYRTRWTTATHPNNEGDLPVQQQTYDPAYPERLSCHLGHDGAKLFPFVCCDLSDLDFELHGLTLTGAIPNSTVTGPNQ
jgi:hypothetical protein